MPALLIAMIIDDHRPGHRAPRSSWPARAGTGWLWENIFWILGHPEVYIILLPPVGAMLEVASTFARKPVFGYKVIVAGFVAICRPVHHGLGPPHVHHRLGPGPSRTLHAHDRAHLHTRPASSSCA